MFQRFKYALVAFALAAACAVIVYRVGSHLDENGILHEAFGFIFLFWLFVFAGLTVSLFQIVKWMFGKK
jgi:hypothetical protein